MNSDPLHVKGLILDSSEFKDKDRIITLLTPDQGIIKVCAKGTSKPGSKNSFITVPFMLCDVVLNDSHGFLYFKEGSIIESNHGIMNNLEAMTVASHISQCLKDVVFQSDISRSAYELAVYAFYALSKFPENYLIIYSAFNWRLLHLLGMVSIYEKCKKCGEVINGNYSYILSIKNDDCYCSKCRSVKYINHELFVMSSSSIEILNYFINTQAASLFSVKIGNSVIIDELKRFTTAYLIDQLEKEYPALINLQKMTGIKW